VTFRDRPRLAVGLCPDPKRIEDRVAAESGAGGTALWDAMMLGIHEIDRASNRRKAILLFSDGGDRDSRYAWNDVRAAVRESGVPIYAFVAPAWTDDQRFDTHRLRELSEDSGGRCFVVNRPEQLVDCVENLDIRWHYTIGYSPAERGEPGKFRRTTLELAGKARDARLRVYWRRGYLAPGN
jgi:Ca-activated chloride channel family protein